MRNIGINITIPTFLIINKKIRSESKILYGLLNSVCNVEGVVKLKYEDLSSLIGYDNSIINICLNELQDNKYITFFDNSIEIIIEIISNITFQMPKKSKKIKNSNNTNFLSIKDNFEFFLTKYDGNKTHLYISFIFWKLWFDNNPNSSTLKKSIIEDWVNDVKLIINNDGHGIDRLIGIYTYFKYSSKDEIGFDNFWFNEISTLKAFRKNTSSGENRIDKIIRKVNDQISKNEYFKKEIIEMSHKIKTNKKLI